ncbi:hypothetical protein [Desulfovibrio litoralis]|uniref:Uncharacterized protein n=1 Tax=Desulfovibrio litoralis DSM 11393 TaxID=1121455 RepID=A0A1M7RZ94_9BACT|nr:hypothetical protein [Desulfovibrio litoralis]SHN51498.1 hypothetical protein SAMN02745728_00355 [Desulfovibrio litoralis DSM 11393]
MCFISFSNNTLSVLAETKTNTQLLSVPSSQALSSEKTNPFLKIDAKDLKEKQAAKMILEKYFSVPEPARGFFVGSLDDLYFDKNGEQHSLYKWTNISIEYRDNNLFVLSGGKKKHLTKITPIEAEDWPKTFLWTDDIDFDQKPDFFVVEQAAIGSGTSKFKLIDWDRKNKDGKPLFMPFDTKNFPPFHEEYEYSLLFNNGITFQPGFNAEKKILTASAWNGPFFDVEQWCFNGSQYFLCKEIKISYYAEAYNMF